MTARFVPKQTARWESVLHPGPIPLDDPAETYHEASKISPSLIGRQTLGARRLDGTPELQLSATRATKRWLHRPSVALPAAQLPELPLVRAITGRRSERAFAGTPIEPAALATLLHGSYGVTHALDDAAPPLQPLRAVPSGGALYPLDVYPLLLRVDGLEPGIYHFDPLRPALVCLRPGMRAEDAAALSTYPEIVRAAAVLFLVVAMLWRTRFKYGLRGYRFALLEAGHLGQNLVLLASALGLGAVPLGGLYDRAVDECLGIDGVNESVVYAVAVGRIARAGT